MVVLNLLVHNNQASASCGQASGWVGCSHFPAHLDVSFSVLYLSPLVIKWRIRERGGWLIDLKREGCSQVEAGTRLRQLLRNADPVYGEGLRQVRYTYSQVYLGVLCFCFFTR